MRRQRLWVAAFLVAGAIGGGWMLTDTPPPGQTVRVEAPASQPVDSSVPPTPLNLDEVLRQATESIAGRALCPAPPEELTPEQQLIVDEVLAKAPLPPTVPGDTPGAVTNIHRRLVPC